MTKQDAAALLVQLYADYSVLCSKYGYTHGNGTAEAVAMAAQALQEVVGILMYGIASER